jgi:hypothetical protein
VKLLELLQLHPETRGIFAVLGVVVGPPYDILDQLFFGFLEVLKFLFQHIVKLLEKGLLPLQLAPFLQLFLDFPLHLSLVDWRLHQGDQHLFENLGQLESSSLLLLTVLGFNLPVGLLCFFGNF